MKKNIFCLLKLVIIAASVILTRQSLPSYDSVWDAVLSNFPEEPNSPEKLDLFANNLSKQKVSLIYFYTFADKIYSISLKSRLNPHFSYSKRKLFQTMKCGHDASTVDWREGIFYYFKSRSEMNQFINHLTTEFNCLRHCGKSSFIPIRTIAILLILFTILTLALAILSVAQCIYYQW